MTSKTVQWKKRALALALIILLAVSLLPSAAFADDVTEGDAVVNDVETPTDGQEDPTGGAETQDADGEGEPADVPEGETDDKNYVAQIGETRYEMFDDAVAAAADGDVIELLADCSTSGLNLSKDLTIKGAHTLTFEGKGIALWGKNLTFEGCTVNLIGIGSTPYSEWSWMAVCASSNASLTLNNAVMTLDGSGAGNAHCMYFTGNNKLNLNGSVLTIRNYVHDALEWDGGDGGYNVNLVNSTYNSLNNRSGFTGTFYATFDHSTVNVKDSSGNGSNGTYYTISNGSNVSFTGNRNWGISAWRIDMTGGSTLTATDNGYSGIWTRVLNVDSSCTLDVERNGGKATGATTNGGIFFQGNGTYTSTLEAGANVIIRNNVGSGIYTKQAVGNMTIGSALITENGQGATYGGGVYNVGTMVLGDAVAIYNNHAATAGDDLYSTMNLSFGPVVAGKSLDETPGTNDCAQAIDGWYDDAEGTRWTNHDTTLRHIVAVAPGAFTSPLAVKAAHGALEKAEYTPAAFSFTKLDAETHQSVAGAAFTLTSAAGDELKAVSDSKGVVTFAAIPMDGAKTDYTLKESSAPTGYVQTAESYTLSFTSKADAAVQRLEDGEVVDVTVYQASAPTVRGEGKALVGSDAGWILLNEPSKVDIQVTKEWKDNDDQDGVRPEKVTVELYDGETLLQSADLTAENQWRFTFTGLREYRDGQKIAYGVKEAAVDGYTTAITGSAEAGFVVTNSHETAKISINVDKLWRDNNNKTGTRPSSVTVKLLADGKDTGLSLTLNAKNGWKGTFENVDKMSGGKAVAYSVQENAVNGYSCKISGSAEKGFHVTNVLGTIPSTGDSNNLLLWSAALCVSLAGLVVLLRRRQNRAK